MSRSGQNVRGNPWEFFPASARSSWAWPPTARSPGASPQAMHAQGAELAFTYGHEKLKDRVEPLAASLGSKIVLPLDVTVDEQIDAVFAAAHGATGVSWTSSCTPWPLRRARRWPATSSRAPPARPSASHTMSPATRLTALSRAAAPLMAGRRARS